MRSSSERVAFHQLGENAKYEPYTVQYQATYKPDFVMDIRELRNVLIEVKATANGATRKQLKELSSSFRKSGTYFIVAVEIPNLRFRLTREEYTQDVKAAGTLSGKKLCSWLTHRQIKWVEYSTHVQLTEARIYERLVRPLPQ
jgi:hypothetical protein